MYPVNDQECLALTMVGEARGEGQEGMEDVGQTVLNRVRHPSWRGASITGVCMKPWQYSCWNMNDPNRQFLLNLPDDDTEYHKAMGIAASLIAGELTDRTDGATYYYAMSSEKPSWAAGKTPCYISGHHLFYRDIA